MFRNETTADQQHISYDDDGQRNTDECKFEESEGRESCCGECAGNDNVRRSTDHGDGTADVSCDCQRHQFLGWCNMRCICDTYNNRHQAGNRTCVGGYGGKDNGNDHDSCHQRNFIRTCLLYNCDTDCFCEACFKHGRTDNEHTTEKYYGGVGKSGVNLLAGQYAENPQYGAGCHCCYCQRNQFRDEQECCYSQDAQCDNGWIHNFHLP